MPATATTQTATDADLEMLRKPGTADRFRHVYHEDGRHTSKGPQPKPWRAKLKYRADDGVTVRVERLGWHATPAGAAREVVKWYQARYGAHWPAFVGKNDPRLSVAGPGWRVRYRKEKGVWLAEEQNGKVWVRAGTFPTRAAAWACLRPRLEAAA